MLAFSLDPVLEADSSSEDTTISHLGQVAVVPDLGCVVDLQVVVAVPVLDIVLEFERAVHVLLDPVVAVPVLDPAVDEERVLTVTGNVEVDEGWKTTDSSSKDTLSTNTSSLG